MILEVLTPEKALFIGEIYLVQVPGTKGSFEVLNNHAPLVSTLEKGRIKIITPEGKEIFFEILSGFIEVKDNQISVLVTV